MKRDDSTSVSSAQIFTQPNAVAEFIRQSKAGDIRSLVFRFNSQQGTLEFRTSIQRGRTSQEDVERLISCIETHSDTSLSLLFVVRTDFLNPLDNEFHCGVIGDCCDSLRSVVTYFSTVFVVRCQIFPNLPNLVQHVWEHLFPLYSETSSYTATDHPTQLVSDGYRRDRGLVISGVVVERSVGSSALSLLESVEPEIFCSQGKCIFLITQIGSRYCVRLFNPDGSCGSCKVPSSVEDRTVHAFMKADILAWLEQRCQANAILSTGPDLHACVDLCDDMRPTSDAHRRRSSHEVLSPPTLDKYQKAPSKRTRNVPDPQASVVLFPPAGG